MPRRAYGFPHITIVLQQCRQKSAGFDVPFLNGTALRNSSPGLPGFLSRGWHFKRHHGLRRSGLRQFHAEV
jgi:hypothetical protein